LFYLIIPYLAIEIAKQITDSAPYAAFFMNSE